MQDASPFHVGEQTVQDRLGVRESIEPWARKVVRPYLPEQHREFYTALPFLIAAARDGDGRPWATILTGPEGFVESPDRSTLRIGTLPVHGDALEDSLARSADTAGPTTGSDIGLLGIELATRRRNRANGRIVGAAAGEIALVVEQAFGNCPQYIHEREWRRVATTAEPRRTHRTFTRALREWIESADTFFTATGYRGEGEDPSFGMDASHRGGEVGFAAVLGARRLAFVDYPGNNHFNTLGNLELDSRMGLLFVDFETGGMLQLTGRARVDWNAPGGGRRVEFELDEAIELRAALPLRWHDAAAAASLRVAKKVRESEDVSSFYFEAADDSALPDFAPGQHLPIELLIDGEDRSSRLVRRTYSLSNEPGRDQYRISVKREPLGVASRHLHDTVQVGNILNTRTPAGEFVLEPGTRAVVLISAGVGVTPMLSMLRGLVAMSDTRDIAFLHGARDSLHHPFAAEVKELTAASRVRTHVAYSSPLPHDLLGRDYDAAGRMNGAHVAAVVPDLDADFYLCGPTAFMADVQAELEHRGVPTERIHSESFGPAS